MFCGKLVFAEVKGILTATAEAHISNYFINGCHEMEQTEKKIHEELNELFAATKRYKECDGYKDLLDFIGKFRNIAPYNAMLLNAQKPGSRYVASASEWKEKFKRTVKVGATPLVTLFPFGPVRFVFELNDTEGRPFPEELLNPFKCKNTTDYRKEYLHLMKSAAFDGVLCREQNCGTEAAGLIGAT